MKNMLKNSILSLGLIIGSIGLYGQGEAYDNYIEKAVKDYELPGLAISVVTNDSVLFQKAYGYANAEKKTPLSTKSVFGIASLSKAFTAACIGVLVDEGKLDWEDRVQKYLPYFRLSDEYVASQMTIEDLLSHRSGFKTFDGDLLWYMSDYTPKEIVERFSKYELSYDHRTQYGYQNIMFIAAGLVVEEVSGMSLEKFMKEKIFIPLEMNSTYTSIDQFNSETPVAMPHVKGELDQLRNYDNSAGAALLSSQVEDLSKWIQMWLNNGKAGDKQVLSEATVSHLLSMQTPISISGFDQRNGVEFKGYAQGWFLLNYGGHKVAHHGGGLPGYISKIFIVPSENYGGIILTNGETSLPTALMLKTIDEVEKVENGDDWADIILGYSKAYEARKKTQTEERHASRNKKLKPNVDQSELMGVYEDEYYGQAEVSMKNGDLFLSLLPAKDYFSSKMEHWQQNTYRIKFKDKFLPEGFVTFHLDANGEVTNFTIDLPNPDFHFYNLDFKKLKD